MLLATLWAAVNNVHAEETLALPDQGITVGEHLTYAITWLKIPVGTGEVLVKEKTVLNGREVFHVTGTIETNKVLRKIFPMHDQADSWMDAATFESVQFEKKIDEFLNNAHERMVYDPDKGKGYLQSFKTGKKSEFKITVPVYDVLSGFFSVRRQLLGPDQKFKIIITADQKDWIVDIPGFSRETLKMRGIKIDTLLIHPVTRVDGKETRGRAWFNVSTDSSRKPLKIIYKAPFGSVVGTLVETKNS